MSYYTLVLRDKAATNPKWGIEFGAYDRDDVEGELEDWKDQNKMHYNNKLEFKIIRTNTARQSEINAKLAELNAQ